jgi:hypothetical protein
MIGGIPPDPQHWQVDAERRAELLRSGRSTSGAVGVIVDLLLGFFGGICSGLARLWRKRR